ncbi:MAG: ribonuclease HII [Candidatus Yanofskybacteria bacterium RIFCSPHIGHO2_01_FULL_41_21]|uniref:Ribonuclease HII n=1 Tax=Candidatus Yanofskybacteria bacterium RIFCSPHIGHO2_01_FULL_41_21 TaxID=1802660 RepID=A0A1F8E8R3_9BACT|nr:MAG: ribonuclease HII [Candidatus Yanofskybacteria bacterium RIFCSPHIGHO2_01_FULL_41_21]
MKSPQTIFERNLLKTDYNQIIGVDEVGVGCLAGPVVVCAISFSNEFYKNLPGKFRGLKESKSLSAQQREKFAKELSGQNYKLGVCYPKKIDAINIYQATRLAMRRAVKNVSSKNSRAIVLVDGNKKIENLKFDQRAIVKGDQKIFAIACASVIAKVYRDKMMKRYAKQFPAYGFEQHKGYSTKAHQDALNKFGPCLIHRQSFRLIY